MKSALMDDGDQEEARRSRRIENFSCNICLDLASNAVLATCGHLFCWHCLYQWLLIHKICPVCRGACDVDSVVPIYGRRGEGEDDEQRQRPIPTKDSRTLSTSTARPLHILDSYLLPSIHPPTLPAETPARPPARRRPAPGSKQPNATTAGTRSAAGNPTYSIFGRWGTRPRSATSTGHPEGQQRPPTHFNPMILFAAAFALLALRQMQWDPLGLSGASPTLSNALRDGRQKWTAAAKMPQKLLPDGSDALSPTEKAMCMLAAIIIAGVWFH